MLRKILIVMAGLFLTVGSVWAEAQEIETGENYITNGLIKIEVQTVPRHRVLYSVWNEEEKTWARLFSGGVGYGAGQPFDLLSTEPAEEVKIEKTKDTATMEFKLTDRTKYRGKGGEGFYQVYKITIWKDKYRADMELRDEEEGGKGQMGWVYRIKPQPARYLIGKKVHRKKSILDCQEIFEEKAKTRQIGTGRNWVGAYNPENGYLYIVNYPKRHYLITYGSKEGVRQFSHLNDNFSIYGINIGENKEATFAVESAEKILAEKEQ